MSANRIFETLLWLAALGWYLPLVTNSRCSTRKPGECFSATAYEKAVLRQVNLGFREVPNRDTLHQHRQQSFDDCGQGNQQWNARYRRGLPVPGYQGELYLKPCSTKDCCWLLPARDNATGALTILRLAGTKSSRMSSGVLSVSSRTARACVHH